MEHNVKGETRKKYEDINDNTNIYINHDMNYNRTEIRNREELKV